MFDSTDTARHKVGGNHSSDSAAQVGYIAVPAVNHVKVRVRVAQLNGVLITEDSFSGVNRSSEVAQKAGFQAEEYRTG